MAILLYVHCTYRHAKKQLITNIPTGGNVLCQYVTDLCFSSNSVVVVFGYLPDLHYTDLCYDLFVYPDKYFMSTLKLAYLFCGRQ